MLKAAARTNEGSLIMLGLSWENLRRLKDREPMKIDMKEFGFSSGNIFIFSQEDESAMGETMKELIGPETKVSAMPRPSIGGRPRKR